MTSGIYKITHRESGKSYIGRSVHIEKRWCEHRWEHKGRPGTYPLYNAMKKHGIEAFDFEIILCAPPEHLRDLEREVIESRSAMRPGGYNVGGTHGGFLSKEEIVVLSADEQDIRRQATLKAALAGHEALREKRKNLAYEAKYLEIRSQASFKREANIATRRAADPAYDAKIREAKSRGGKSLPRDGVIQRKAAETFKKRMGIDADFAELVRANRSRAAKSGDAKLRQENMQKRKKTDPEFAAHMFACGSRAGFARAAALTPERRKEIGRLAGAGTRRRWEAIRNAEIS